MGHSVDQILPWLHFRNIPHVSSSVQKVPVVGSSWLCHTSIQGWSASFLSSDLTLAQLQRSSPIRHESPSGNAVTYPARECWPPKTSSGQGNMWGKMLTAPWVNSDMHQWYSWHKPMWTYEGRTEFGFCRCCCYWTHHLPGSNLSFPFPSKPWFHPPLPPSCPIHNLSWQSSSIWRLPPSHALQHVVFCDCQKVPRASRLALGANRIGALGPDPEGPTAGSSCMYSTPLVNMSRTCHKACPWQCTAHTGLVLR